MNKVVKWVGISIIGLGVIGAAMESAKSPEQKAAESAAREQEAAQAAEAEREKAKQEMDALPAVTASEIARAYSENTVAADQQFKGKKFKVTGTVDDISTDIMGDPYVTLRGGVNQFMEPQFSFDKSASDQLASLKKGAKVTLVCTGKGDVAKTAMSGDCMMM